MALESTNNLAQAVEQELGHSVFPSSDRTRIVDLLDRAHKIVCSGGGELNLDKNGDPVRRPVIFPWAVSQNPIAQNFEAPITTGTVAATQSSNSVTLSAAQSSNLTNWYIKVGSDDEIYRISAHTAGTDTITLDAPYVESNVTASTYTAFKLRYTFSSSSLLIPISPVRLYSENSRDLTADIVDMNTLLTKYPLTDIDSDMPECAGVNYFSDGQLTLQFSHYPEEIERMELDYVSVPSTLVVDSVDPIIPKHHRILLVHMACYYMMRQLDDDRASSHLQDAKRLFDALVVETEQFYRGNDELFGYVMPRSGLIAADRRLIGAPVDSY